jgi:two-component system cell cycle response regulator
MESVGRRKILIADDDKLNVSLMENYLSDDYDIITVNNGDQALEQVKKEQPDLILLDVIMPGIDGFDVCKIIKHDYHMDFIPIVMLTALTSMENHEKGIESGADDFLVKPASKFELNKKISSLLRIKEQHDILLTDRNKAYDYLDYVGVLVVVVDTDYKLVHINKKGSELIGYGIDEIIHKPWITKAVPTNYADYVKDIYDNLQKGIVNSYEYHEYPILTSNGNERLFKWYDSLLFDAHGKFSGILMSGEDITDKRMAELKMQEYAKQLEHSNELKDLFTDVLRHDLLNPAGLIRSFTEILEETDLDSNQKKLIRNIKKSNSQLIELIEDAAQLAKVEAMDDLAFVRIDAASFLRDVVNSFKYNMDSKGIKAELMFEGSYPVLANHIIAQVFSNLVSNAIKYGKNEGIIKIKIDDIGDKWKIFVIDQGDGIPDDAKATVFDRFKRLHQAQIKGSGLGLAIVKRIVDLHGESVGVIDNPEGCGSAFYVTFKKAY